MWRVGELFGGKLFRALGAGEHYADYADTIGGRHPGLRTKPPKVPKTHFR